MPNLFLRVPPDNFYGSSRGETSASHQLLVFSVPDAAAARQVVRDIEREIVRWGISLDDHFLCEVGEDITFLEGTVQEAFEVHARRFRKYCGLPQEPNPPKTKPSGGS